MYIAKSRTTPKFKKKKMIDMLRKKRKFNHIKWSIKTKEGRKEWKKKNR